MFHRVRFGAILCSFSLAVGVFADAPPTLRDQLNADQATGKLSLDDATVLRVVALTHYNLLPEEYRLPVGQYATELALELSRDVDRSHPEVQAVARYLAAPGHVRKNLKKPAIKAAKLARKDVAASAVEAAAITIASTPSLSSTRFTIEYDPRGSDGRSCGGDQHRTRGGVRGAHCVRVSGAVRRQCHRRAHRGSLLFPQ